MLSLKELAEARVKKMEEQKWTCAMCGALPFYNEEPLHLVWNRKSTSTQQHARDQKLEDMELICPNCSAQSRKFYRHQELITAEYEKKYVAWCANNR